jgi:uncharacterized protein YhdP
MRVIGASARMVQAEGLQLSRIEAQIPDFMNTTTVVVSADIRGPAPLAAYRGEQIPHQPDDRRRFVPCFAQWRGRQAGSVCSFPWRRWSVRKCRGTVTLAGNDVRMTPDTPLMAKARGARHVFPTVVSRSSVGQARMLGGDLRLEGGTRAGATGAESVVLLRAQGTVTADGLRQATELGFFSRLARHATGGAAYSGSLGFRGGLPELMLASNLQGLGLNLPLPFGKAVDTVLPLRYENTLVARPAASGRIPEAGPVAGGARTPWPRWPLCATCRARNRAFCAAASGVGLATGESAPQPERGVAANINLASLNIDSWGGCDVQCGGRFPWRAPIRQTARLHLLRVTFPRSWR